MALEGRQAHNHRFRYCLTPRHETHLFSHRVQRGGLQSGRCSLRAWRSCDRFLGCGDRLSNMVWYCGCGDRLSYPSSASALGLSPFGGGVHQSTPRHKWHAPHLFSHRVQQGVRTLGRYTPSGVRSMPSQVSHQLPVYCPQSTHGRHSSSMVPT